MKKPKDGLFQHPAKAGSLGVLGAFALAASLLSGCGAALSRPQEPGAVLDLGAGLIVVDPAQELPPRFWDAYSLMHQGQALFDAKKYAEALPVFRTLAKNFLETEIGALALFNLGACYEKMERYQEALSVYQGLEKREGPKITLKELLARQLSCLEELQDWPGAIGVIKRLLALPLSVIEEVDIRLRMGMAQYMSGAPSLGKETLRRGLREHRKLARNGLPLDNYYAAKAHFMLGEIYFDRYEAVRLEGRGEELAIRLETKAELLLLARGEYLRSMRTYEGRWMAASLHKLGVAYESFYFALLEAPLPPDLEAGEEDLYRNKLKKRIKGVLRKAVDAYERNVWLDEEFKLRSPWAARSRERLENLRRGNGVENR